MPPRSEWAWRIGVGCAICAWFFAVYIAADWWTGRLAETRDFPSPAIALDAAIPFAPEAAWAYMTVAPFMAMPLLVLTARRVRALAWTEAVMIALAGIVFVTFPMAATVTPEGAGPAIMHFADWVNLTYNSLPSLHVALSTSTLIALVQGTRGGLRVTLILWGIAVIGSTLLTKQHYVLDAVAGVALAVLCYVLCMPALLSVQRRASRT